MSVAVCKFVVDTILQTARRSLNLLLAEWANRGLNLWTIQLQEKPITAGDNKFDRVRVCLGQWCKNAGQQIVDITDVVIRDSSNNDFSANSISRSTYLNYAVKTTSGRPTQYYFERTINPRLYLYPAADVDLHSKYIMLLIRMKDAGDYTNNAEIPFRFLPCMTAGLAYYM